jgi:hypothetical protein
VFVIRCNPLDGTTSGAKNKSASPLRAQALKQKHTSKASHHFDLGLVCLTSNAAILRPRNNYGCENKHTKGAGPATHQKERRCNAGAQRALKYSKSTGPATHQERGCCNAQAQRDVCLNVYLRFNPERLKGMLRHRRD